MPATRISRVAPDGNGSYTLAGGQVPDPSPREPGSLEQHKAGFAMSPLRSVSLCGSCHRGFLHPDLGVKQLIAGGDVITPHLSSGYAGNRLTRLDDPVDENDCIGCHMPKVEATEGDLAADGGMVASHRFLGANTWMAAMRSDDVQLEALKEQLRDIVSIDVAAVTLSGAGRFLPADGAPVSAGDRAVFDVVVRNLKVGHLFPGAALDVQDTWIEVDVRDRSGRAMAEAGQRHERSGRDPTAHVLSAWMVDSQGRRLRRREFHRFDSVVKNLAIGPRDAVAVRYALHVPDNLPPEALPLTVTATVRHRRSGLELQELACDVARSGRGRAFARATRRMGRDAMDPCTDQPVVDIARTRIAVGEGSVVSDDAASDWRRSYELGLALTHQVQEHLDEATESLLVALELASENATAAERAMVQAALARVAAHQGRTAEALAWIDKAEVGAPGHPALAALRGEALARVWRWQQAVQPLREAAESAPGDVRAWTRLATALGSSLRDREALEAAQVGLSLWPQKPELLRAQALALQGLGHSQAESAMEAYLVHRGHDDPSAVRMACARGDEDCARERLPVHVHELRTAIR